MLRIDLRDLRHGPVDVQAQVAPGDPVLEGLDIELVGPLDVGGRLQATGTGEYFWQAQLRGSARSECRRCLAEVPIVIAHDVGLLFSSDDDAQEDPDVYPVLAGATHLELNQAVREELALAVPAFPLCRDDCAGLCPRCGADLNAGPCACAAAAQSRRG